jgi:haloalkane dehalogenase
MPMSFREAGAQDAPVALLLHGYPNSSYLWRDVLGPVADAGFRAVAPDFPGFGDSPPLRGRAGTWDDHVQALDDFVAEHDLAPVVLVVHDWGGLIGLRWACDRPYAVRGLVLMSTGFFPDGRWHGLAQGLRTPGQGEQIMASITRETFAELLRSASPRITEEALDEYWKAFVDDERRASHLALYRSGDFDRVLAPYEGRLARLGVPALILWGENDAFSPVSGARRFARELPDSELVILEDTGHFPQEDVPERVAAEIARFLRSLP